MCPVCRNVLFVPWKFCPIYVELQSRDVPDPPCPGLAPKPSPRYFLGIPTTKFLNVTNYVFLFVRLLLPIKVRTWQRSGDGDMQKRRRPKRCLFWRVHFILCPSPGLGIVDTCCCEIQRGTEQKMSRQFATCHDKFLTILRQMHKK